MVEIAATERTPDILMIAMAPDPGGVACAKIESSLIIWSGQDLLNVTVGAFFVIAC